MTNMRMDNFEDHFENNPRRKGHSKLVAKEETLLALGNPNALKEHDAALREMHIEREQWLGERAAKLEAENAGLREHLRKMISMIYRARFAINMKDWERSQVSAASEAAGPEGRK